MRRLSVVAAGAGLLLLSSSLEQPVRDGSWALLLLLLLVAAGGCGRRRLTVAVGWLGVSKLLRLGPSACCRLLPPLGFFSRRRRCLVSGPHQPCDPMVPRSGGARLALGTIGIAGRRKRGRYIGRPNTHAHPSIQTRREPSLARPHRQISNRGPPSPFLRLCARRRWPIHPRPHPHAHAQPKRSKRAGRVCLWRWRWCWGVGARPRRRHQIIIPTQSLTRHPDTKRSRCVQSAATPPTHPRHTTNTTNTDHGRRRHGRTSADGGGG